MEQKSFSGSLTDVVSSIFGQGGDFGQATGYDQVRTEAYSAPRQRTSEAAQAALPQLSLEHAGKGVPDPNARSVVVVDIPHKRTHVLQMKEGELQDVLSVADATGKKPGLTKEGRFHITSKNLSPSYSPPPGDTGVVIPPGPDNPLGAASIGTDADHGFQHLHGTNNPRSIGKAASAGCIRHNNEDILKIYGLVDVGDVVYFGRDFKHMKLSPSDFQ